MYNRSTQVPAADPALLGAGMDEERVFVVLQTEKTEWFYRQDSTIWRGPDVRPWYSGAGGWESGVLIADRCSFPAESALHSRALRRVANE